MKKLLIIVFALFGCLVGWSFHAFAQSVSSSSAASVHITFPIAALGNCTSITDCKTYCDDPTHIDACIAFAKANGFYQESQLDTKEQQILTDAKTTLGCDSLPSCRVYCQDSTHADACAAFAQRHNLQGGKQSTPNQTLAKAEMILGCTSIDTCRVFCSVDANKSKCDAFAKENGLKGGNQTMGPGGCTSEDSCKTFCSDPTNFQVCSQFISEHTGSESGQKVFTGPGGCTSQQSCQSFCSQHPQDCHLNPAGHEDAMSATAAAHVQEMENCRENPQECKGTPSAGLRPQSFSGQEGLQEFHPSGQPTFQHPPLPQQGNEDGFHNGNTFSPSRSQSQGEGSAENGPPEVSPLPSPLVTLSVKGVATSPNFFQWVWQMVFHP